MRLLVVAVYTADNDAVIIHLRNGLVAGPPSPKQPGPYLRQTVLRLVGGDRPIDAVVVGDELAQVALWETLGVVHL